MDNSPVWDEVLDRMDVPPGSIPPYNRTDLAPHREKFARVAKVLGLHNVVLHDDGELRADAGRHAALRRVAAAAERLCGPGNDARATALLEVPYDELRHGGVKLHQEARAL
jgi:hypothetical protein